MPEEVANFIKNRQWKLKNSARFAFWVLSMVGGLALPWANTVLAEKITMGVILWIYLCFVLFYATNARMQSRRKRNAFYSCSVYCFSWLMLYMIYRFLFADFHYLLIIYISYGLLQTAIWISGVFFKIRKNKYTDESAKHLGINSFTVVALILGVGMMVANGCILGFMGTEALKIVFTILSLCMNFMCLPSLTFLIQWRIMKKYDYDETVA